MNPGRPGTPRGVLVGILGSYWVIPTKPSLPPGQQVGIHKWISSLKKKTYNVVEHYLCFIMIKRSHSF